MMWGSKYIAPITSEIQAHGIWQVCEPDFKTKTVYVKLENCNDLIPIKIHIDDYNSTTVEEMDSLVTDLMVRLGLYRGQTKHVAKFTYREKDWRLIGRWETRGALFSELDYQDESIVHASLSKERVEGARSEVVSKRGRPLCKTSNRDVGTSVSEYYGDDRAGRATTGVGHVQDMPQWGAA